MFSIDFAETKVVDGKLEIPGTVYADREYKFLIKNLVLEEWNTSIIHESLIEEVISHLNNEFVQKCVKNHFDFIIINKTYKNESDFVKWFDFITEFKEESLEKIEHESLF